MPPHEVTLYFAPGSSSIFPHFLLHYCNIPFKPLTVRVSRSDSPHLAEINSKQQVPVLLLDGETITENPAIAHAIHHLAPGKHIFGHSPIDFIRVCEWMNYISASLHAQTWSPYMRPWRFTTDQSAEAQAAVKTAAEQNVRERFSRVENMIDGQGPWALGESFTAVDAYLFVFYRVGMRVLKADMKEDYPTWGRIAERLMGMEAMERALKDETTICSV